MNKQTLFGALVASLSLTGALALFSGSEASAQIASEVTAPAFTRGKIQRLSTIACAAIDSRLGACCVSFDLREAVSFVDPAAARSVRIQAAQGGQTLVVPCAAFIAFVGASACIRSSDRGSAWSAPQWGVPAAGACSP